MEKARCQAYCPNCKKRRYWISDAVWPRKYHCETCDFRDYPGCEPFHEQQVDPAKKGIVMIGVIRTIKAVEGTLRFCHRAPWVTREAQDALRRAVVLLQRDVDAQIYKSKKEKRE